MGGLAGFAFAAVHDVPAGVFEKKRDDATGHDIQPVRDRASISRRFRDGRADSVNLGERQRMATVTL